jgi:hypothetical protein
MLHIHFVIYYSDFTALWCIYLLICSLLGIYLVNLCRFNNRLSLIKLSSRYHYEHHVYRYRYFSSL